MASPRFLTTEQVLVLHRQMVEHYGGAAGLRDRGVLDAAVAMPMATFEGKRLHRTIHDMAAAYLFHICQAHAFEDGNKRAATIAALVFLDVNGYDVDADADEFERLVVGIAAGELGKTDAARFFRKRVRRR